jgi:hypothetical protein
MQEIRIGLSYAIRRLNEQGKAEITRASVVVEQTMNDI